MKITKIEKLSNDLYKLTVNKDLKEETFKVTEEVLIKYKLYNNKELTSEEYTLLTSLVQYSKIYSKTLNFLSYKMRTESEVLEYLQKNNCREPYITEIINKLKKLNYINDQLYCEMYIKHEFDVNKKGPLFIKNSLLTKDIKEDIINKEIEYISDDRIKENIHDLIKYYERTNNSKSINKLKETILRNLIAKGYSYQDILDEINNYPFSSNDNNSLLEKEMIKTYNKLKNKYQDSELKNQLIKKLLGKGFRYEDIIDLYSSLNMEGL